MRTESEIQHLEYMEVIKAKASVMINVEANLRTILDRLKICRRKMSSINHAHRLGKQSKYPDKIGTLKNEINYLLGLKKKHTDEMNIIYNDFMYRI